MTTNPTNDQDRDGIRGPERVPLVHLARPSASPALTRIIAKDDADPAPGKVAVAAFSSSV